MKLVRVTKEEFFSIIWAQKLNVHPRPMPDASYWELPGRVLWGKSIPGWKGIGPKEYFIVQPTGPTNA